MIDLEDAQLRKRIAIGEGVESRAEDDVLPDAVRYRRRQRILGEPAAHDEERAKVRPSFVASCAGGFVRNSCATSGRMIRNAIGSSSTSGRSRT